MTVAYILNFQWEDVGDYVAREKASQVLRDAVSEKNGPMTKSGKKPPTESRRANLPIEPMETLSAYEASGQQNGQENLMTPVSVESSQQAQELRPDWSASNFRLHQPYVHRGGNYRNATNPEAHAYYPSVTPASSAAARKRPRVQDIPMLSFNYFSTPNSSVMTNTPPPTSMSPSFHHQRLMYPSSSYYSYASSHYSPSQHHSPASAMIPSHYLNQSGGRRNEPWVADIHNQLPAHSSTTQYQDFDLYNEELLSDHSDHRDGSLSPIMFSYPK